MDVFLIPVGVDRYELYCEMPDDDPDAHAAPQQRGFFKNLIARFREAIAEAERERHRPAVHRSADRPNVYQRVKSRLLCRIAETIAEQRLLWHLRRRQTATLHHPDDLTADAAMSPLRASLQADLEKHRRWLIIDGILFALSGALVLVPGPNVLAYYLGFRLVGHYFSLRGARRGLDGVQWTLSPSAALAELRRAITMPPDQRTACVSDVAARLRLERLVTFFQHTVVPSA